MSTRNTQLKTARTRTTTKSRLVVKKDEIDENKLGALDFLRFGESYTSLILGIIVVVIATVLLLSFVRGRNLALRNAARSQKVAVENQVKKLPNKEHKNTPIVKNEAKLAAPVAPEANTYTVKSGDSLWTIAEQKYNSGYNWIDIAQANKLSNPGVLYSGMKLALPQVSPKLATASTTTPTNSVITNQGNTPAQPIVTTDKIAGNTYTIQKGDNLWQIAVRAYGDGYQWVKIAKANDLTDPGLIHVGNSLSIPR